MEFPAAVYRQAASGPGKVFTRDPNALTVRGVPREQQVPLGIQLASGRLVARALVVRPQDFGIQPFSALGGLLQM